MSTIVVYGATGYAGGHIVDEALRRGHTVVGVSRGTPVAARPGLTARTGSVADPELAGELAAGADALVVAVRFEDGTLGAALPDLLDAAAKHGARLGVVGGAGSSLVADGGPRLIDTPAFPDVAKAEATPAAAALEALRAAGSAADWFYVSPAAGFGSYAPGERTGTYRTGGDILVTAADGTSSISGADYAVAFVDEIETPAHHRTRFTVGY